ncbi:MAG: xanthine dehydrogenase accessory protein XdhC [Rhodobacteraceae bacterium]|nr:MAG: xanthine dehydrogenase accessory protein XdhC [Paracoccaceae bacterium]
MSESIHVTVVETRGSTPREVGAAMQVWADRIEGTIGGGTLEWQAIAQARQMLAEDAPDMQRKMALGPDMGQCCGGVVVLAFRHVAEDRRFDDPPLWIWGAGHVGRAIAGVMGPLGFRQILLIDVEAARLPDPLPQGVEPLVASDPLRMVPHAPQHAHHLVLTYSHDLDLKLCDALLRQGFGECGLIGSATKWARFRKRLAAMGHEEAQIARISCPIGDPALGKHPQAIAVGVVARYLGDRHTRSLPEERRA